MDLPIDFLQFLGYPTTRESFRPPKRKIFRKEKEEHFHIHQIIQRKKEKQTGSKIFKYLILSFLVFVFILIVTQPDNHDNLKLQQNINAIEQQLIITTKNVEINQKVQEKRIQSIDQQLQGQIIKRLYKKGATCKNTLISYFFPYGDLLQTDFQPVQVKQNQNQKTQKKTQQIEQTLGAQELQSTINLNDDKIQKIDTNDSFLDKKNILDIEQTRVVLVQQAKCDSQKKQLKSQYVSDISQRQAYYARMRRERAMRQSIQLILAIVLVTGYLMSIIIIAITCIRKLEGK